MFLMEGRLQHGEALIMQNGLFSTLPEHKKKSDTAIMCETLTNYTDGNFNAEKVINLLMIVSPLSKFVVASTESIWRTMNFVKDEYGLFSNTTHLKPKPKYKIFGKYKLT